MTTRIAGSALAAGNGAGLGAVAGSGAGAGHVAAKVDGAGQENAVELADDGASIQIILEPRMIEKNSVRTLDC